MLSFCSKEEGEVLWRVVPSEQTAPCDGSHWLQRVALVATNCMEKVRVLHSSLSATCLISPGRPIVEWIVSFVICRELLRDLVV